MLTAGSEAAFKPLYIPYRHSSVVIKLTAYYMVSAQCTVAVELCDKMHFLNVCLLCGVILNLSQIEM